MTKYLQLEKEIEIALNIRIEQTTLRRFFKEKESLSASNLNVLLDFVKQNTYGYFDFENMHNGTKSCKSTLWKTKQEEAEKITTQTLAYLQNARGIKETLPCVVLQEKINSFLMADAPVLAIVGEGGLGKSTAIAQWVSAYTQQNPQDIVYTLPTKNTERHFFEYLPHLNPLNNEKVIIILDALDELTYSPDKIANVANFFIGHYNRCGKPAWLKFIFTSRSVVWKAYKKYFDNALAYQEIQMNKLDTNEVFEILKNNIPTLCNPFDISVYMHQMLQTPLYLRFFIQVFIESGKEITSKNQLQLIELFVTHFIGSDKEKRDIIGFILQEITYFENMKIGVEEKELKNKYKIDKVKSMYHKAYQELLNSGILTKVNIKTYGTQTINYVDISHMSILEYLVFEYLIKGRNNAECFDYIIQKYGTNVKLFGFRDNLIRLVLQKCYQQNDMKALEVFYNLPLGNNFIYFWEINYNLAYEYPEIAEKVWQFWAKNTNAQTYFFEIFTNFKYLTKANLAEAWAHYQEYKTDDEAKIFSHAVLLKTYLLKNNQELARKHYEALQNLEPTNEIHPYPIARRWAYMRQYEAFIGKEIDTTTLAETDKLAYDIKMNLPTQINHRQDMELYLFYETLICQTLNMAGKAEEVLKRIEEFTRPYPNIQENIKKIILEAEKMIAEVMIGRTIFDDKLLEKVKGFYEQNLLWDIEELYLRLLYLSEKEGYHQVAKNIAKDIGFSYYKNK
ncbi:MAG: hypothetical protein EAZ95_00220 [Bacteroidetes bacterium]|nr:MAG: hypothetical protein EAZ95_00220 [Bacteroidota bacterium]